MTERRPIDDVVDQLVRRTAALEAERTEPVAIVGVGCRFPGGGSGPDRYWDALMRGVDGVGPVSTRFGPTDGPAWAALIDDIDRFDAAFFGISPREARLLDPQHRLLLEVAWEALEHAGIVPSTLDGTRTGVFVGASTADYLQRVLRLPVGEREAYGTTGNMNSIAAGRIAYTLGLRGPALTIDTACSSSLVAVHLAVRSLRARESDVALAAGVNVIASVDTMRGVGDTQALSPDGRCRTFDAAANGFVRGEGCGAVVLKRLSDATRDGDLVMALILGSAVNQDGRSTGLTAPNVLAQQAVVRDALANARVEPREVGYVEAHGTGTPLGDPIEVEALRAVFGAGPSDVVLGAVKTHIGHLEAAAGIAGLVKVALALDAGAIPQNLQFRVANPRLPLAGSRLRLATETRRWPRGEVRRVAGVSAFGMSGTNAHVVLAEPPADPTPAAPPRAFELWVASGRTAEAADRAVGELVAYVAGHPAQGRGDVARALATTRAHHRHRRVAVVPADAPLTEGAFRAVGAPGTLGFLFPGQGAQTVGMGHGAARAFPAFRDGLDEALAALSPWVGGSLADRMGGDPAGLADTRFGQPALFAYGVALVRWWASAGVAPAWVAGHSVGELTAAWAAGAVSLADAARFVAERAAHMAELPAGGAMAVVAASEDTVRTSLPPDVSIAAVNGAASVVVSGPAASVDRVCAQLGVHHQRLVVSHAFHSAAMDPAVPAIRASADAIAWRPPTVPLISSLTGAPLATLDGSHWARQLREPVRFRDQVAAIRALGGGVFVELGPRASLTTQVRAEHPDVVVVASGSPGEELRAVLETAAAIHGSGGAIALGALWPDGGRRCRLPTYPWADDRYWIEAGPTPSGEGTGHPLLGVRLALAGARAVFESAVTPAGWMLDHRVGDDGVLPGVAIGELLRAAGERVGLDPAEVTDLALERWLPVDQPRSLQVALTERGDRWEAELWSRPADGPWVRHATGAVRRAGVAAAVDPATDGRCVEPIEPDDVYADLAACGLPYGPSFRGIRALRRGAREAVAQIVLPGDAGPAEGWGLHPALLDAAMQVAVASSGGSTLSVPFAIDRIAVHRLGATAARVVARWTAPDRVDVWLDDARGPIAEVLGVAVRPVERAPETRAEAPADAVFTRVWVDAPAPAGPRPAGAWSVAGESPLAQALRDRIDAGNGSELEVVVWDVPDDGPDTTERVVAAALEHLRATRARRLWWVTACPDERPAVAALWGLARTVALERPELGLTLVDADRADDVSAELGTDDGEREVRWRDGARRVARLVAAPAWPAGDDVALGIPRRGSLDRLAWSAASRLPPGPGEVEIEVRATGLNFRDVLNALGLYPGDPGPLGGECAGWVRAVGEGVDLRPGTPVLAFGRGMFRGWALADARLVAPIPAGLSFEQAATVPVVFMTAWYALRDVGRVRPGERVLVHAAAGGVGMAAVQIARGLGAEVVATAHPSKWDVVRSLGVSEVATSRDPSFADRFRATGGVDVVLDALAGELVDAGLSLLGPGGRFLELGKTDVRDPDTIGGGITYRAFDLTDAGIERLGEILREVCAAFADGSLHPLPVRPFPSGEAEAAFRHVAQARHVGKVALVPPRRLRTDGAVWITGGLGALGGHVARWLAARGVRHLVLSGRRGRGTPGAEALIAELEAAGARVTVAPIDVADADAVQAWVGSIPDLRGVVHTAGVLDDGMSTEQTAERAANVLAPKVRGGWNLDRATRHLDLDWFVLFSSAAGAMGSSGQAPYSAANAWLDALAAARVAAGHSARSLAWGAWAGGGMAGTLDGSLGARLARQGVRALSPEQGLPLLELATRRTEPTLVLMPLDLGVVARQLGSTPPPIWRALIRPRAAPSGSDLASQVAEGRLDAVEAEVRAEVARILSLAGPDRIAPDEPLLDAGLDSLMAVELRNALGARLGRVLPATLAFDHPSCRAIAAHLVGADRGADGGARSVLPLAAAGPVDDDPIVIVGVGCRFPGGVDSPDALWALLEREVDAVGEVPADRWDAAAWYDPDPDAPGKSVTRWGGFVDGIESFDAPFFGFGAQEARSVDPQERLLLETAWEAFERAGIRADELGGSRTGVYVGLCTTEYQLRTMGDPTALDAHALLGSAHSAMVGRLSYWLGLTGPSLAVDTACSSSLVALHLAVNALRAGECELAVAGGANVILEPTAMVYFSRLRAMSPTGRCRTFSADADGYARAEGAAAVVLERASDAARRGHPVLAVIRGTAVNQDGRSSGPTAPNGPAQQAVIRDALARGGVAPASVGYLECHGTGTPLGDPIEVQAAAAVYGPGRAQPLVLGAIKTNLGHTEGAAGLAGVIKAALALRHGRIPRSLHFDRPNPHIAWDTLPVEVAAEARDWPPIPGRRRAAVSSFGFSGTNAHVVLEQAPEPATSDAGDPDVALVVLSARSEGALAAAADRIRRWPATLADLQTSLATTRTAHEHRAAVVGRSRAEVDLALGALAEGSVPPTAVRGVARAGVRPVFVVPGQGAQRAGMGRELHRSEPEFRAAWDVVDAAVSRETGASLDVDGATIDRVQPALFAYAVALAAWWRSVGVEPAAVVGHSLGEIAAATVAGALSIDDGVAIVCRRSRLLARIAGRGAMALLELGADEAERAIAGVADRVAVAVCNGPRATVISGDPEAVELVLAEVTGRGVFGRRVNVEVASHSPQVDPLLDPLLDALASIRPVDGRVPIRSTVTGGWIGGDALGARYWAENLRRPVRFADAVTGLVADGHRWFVELSPHPLLVQVVEDLGGAAVGSVRRDGSERESLFAAAGAAFVAGVDVAVDRLAAGGRRIELPTYAWQRRRAWIDRAPHRGAGSGHPLLGAHVPAAGRDAVFEAEWSATAPAWLGEHRVGGAVVVPGAAAAEILRAAAERARGASVAIVDLELRAPLVLDVARRVQVVVDADRATLHAQPVAGGAWVTHATAGIAGATDRGSERPSDWPSDAPGDEETDEESLYAAFAGVGLDLGPAFRGIREVRARPGATWARIAAPDDLDVDGYGIHPALLDAALQSAALGVPVADRAIRLPLAIGRFEVHHPGARAAAVHARVVTEAGSVRADLWIVDDRGAPIATVEGLRTVPVDLASFGRPTAEGLTYRIEWRPAPLAGRPGWSGRWQVDDPALAAAFRADGAEVVDGPADHRVVVDAEGLLAAARGPARIWVVTRAAVSLDVDAAALAGLGRTLASERPGAVLVHADDPVAAIRAELGADDGETEVGWWDGGRHAPRLVRWTPPPPARPPTDGAVVISGGLGAVGLHLARWLARGGTRRIALLGRRGLDAPEPGAAVAELQALGAEVEVHAVDVADEESLRGVLDQVRAAAPIRWVVHAAGTLRDATLDRVTAQDLAAAARAKLDGARALDRCTADDELSAFVATTSIAGVLGAAGQGAHAAANAALDAFVSERRAAGRPFASVGLGPWSGGGMASALDPQLQARLVARGIRPMAPDVGVDAVARAIADGGTVVAAAFEWGAAGRVVVPPLLRVLAPQAPRASAALTAVPESRRALVALEWVRTEVARALSIADPRDVPPDRPLQELGLDSLLATELRSALGRRFGVPLSATLAFDHPTARAIAHHLTATAVPARAANLRAATDEPIAIVGFGCRFPGGVNDAASLWRLLEQGVDAIREVPPTRFDVDAWYDPDPRAAGKITSRWGGFVDDLERFEPGFFGLSRREAASVDPQERLLLETTWEALEHAGIPAGALMGSDTGVYLGVCGTEYQQRAMGDPAAIDAWSLLGTLHSAMVGRLSYWLGLRGPNVPIDTACSSSLVALHLACRALRDGDCSMALAGGANVLLDPEGMVYFSRMGAMSPTGRCRTFSSDADGYVRAEGAGVVVLERLSDAVRRGHRVLAVVRGTAVNQDGRSNGPTAPNGPAQEEVLRRALERAGVPAATVDYLECHGTATPLGDPIELGAAAAVYGEGRAADRPLWLGSVKTNFGHAEGAAGIAGVLKVVASLVHGAIPRSLHYAGPNPRVAWDALPIAVADRAIPWPAGVRRAAVSSFGFSGTNAHAVLEQAPAAAPASAPERPSELLVVSARTEASLERRVADVLAVDAPLGDLAHTLATRRTPLTERLAVVVRRGEGVDLGRAIRDRARPDATVAFLFTGQGAHRAGMGLELARDWPAARAALDRVAAVVDPLLGRPLDGLLADAAALDRTDGAQVGLFAVQIALAAVWAGLGVVPAAVIGHSVGDLAAAVSVGLMSVDDAARFVVARGRALAALDDGGAMAAIHASEAEVEAALVPGVAVAVVNGPRDCVVSGDAAAVAAVARTFTARAVRVVHLPVSHAFHSPRIAPAADALREAARAIRFDPPSQPGWEAAGDPEFWVTHAIAPVRFVDRLRALPPVDVAIELGPRAVLTGFAAAALGSTRCVASLEAGRPEGEALWAAIGAAFVRGVDLDWTAAFPAGRLVDLPPYPWDRERRWLERRRAVSGRDAGHPLLGVRVDTAGQEVVFERIWTPTDPAWLADHRLGDAPLVPAAALAELARAAAVAAGVGAAVGDLAFGALLRIERPHQVQVVVRGAEVAIHARPVGSEVPFARFASATAVVSQPPPAPVDPRALRARCVTPVDPGALRDAVARAGIELGPLFDRIGALWTGDGEVLAEVRFAGDDDGYGVHPSLVDAAIQAAVAAQGVHALRLPFAIGRFEVHRTGLREGWVHAAGDSIRILGPDGAVAVEIEGLRFRDAERDPALGVDWRPEPAPSARVDGERWELVGDDAVAVGVAVLARPDLPRWVVTRGAVAVRPGERVNPALASAWALVRSIAHERGAQVTLIDLGPDDPVEPAVAAAGDETELAVREGERFVPRLGAVPAGRADRPLRADGVVLVTGAGALARQVARRLTARGVRVVLGSRSGRDGVRLDVTDAGAVQAWIDSLEVPLRGVVHTAGILDDGPAERVDRARLAAVLAPKLDGARVLDRATRALDLDWFVLFSSITGVLGAPGQATYAAANAAMDAIAVNRRAEGIVAHSLAWGPWSGDGMGDGLDPRRLARLGLRPLAPADALDRMERALGSDAPVQVIADLAPEGLRSRYPLVPSLLRRWVPPRPSAAPPPPTDLAAVVHREVDRLLGPDPDPDRPLQERGLDSLLAVELRTALATALGRSIPATIAFDHPTPAAIARALGSPAAVPVPVPLPASDAEPIAIVGVGCRLPGGVVDADSLWALLDEGRDAIREIPADRWDADRWYDPDPDAVGKSVTRWGGFVDGIEQFEPQFFGIGPTEAASVDPQERMLLETAWEALEDAGIPAAELAGSDTGVYVGLCSAEYQFRATADPAALDGYTLLGTAHSAMAGRLSYWLGLTGPNLPVDTACSSSLVAIHLAVEALRRGECSLALAGGANVLLEPVGMVYFSRLRAMSPTGRCRTFSADADGYVRAEGAGVVVLERLSDARRRGHRVLATLRGSAVNQDGRSNGPTAPNGPAQERVIRRALDRAGIAPATVDYLECHGTGTPLGDPVEIQAAAAAYGPRTPDRPLWLGSIKSNLGHTEGAAGVVGVLKAVAALRHGRIPRTLHVDRPNPLVAWDELPVAIATRPVEWSSASGPRRAAVSSFGFSGTNAHVVLEEAPPVDPRPPTPRRIAELIVLSGRTDAALRAVARSLAGPLPDVAFSLATTRTHLPVRLAVVVGSDAELVAALDRIGRGEAPEGASYGVARGRPVVEWDLTGDGSPGAGLASIAAAFPVFAAAYEEAAREGGPGPAGERFAAEVASVALWRSFGIVPARVVGRSAAAWWAAGAASLAQAAAQVGADLGPAPAPAVEATVSYAPAAADLASVLRQVGALHVHGVPIIWSAVFPAGGQRVPLPKTAWRRTRHWIDRASVEVRPAPPTLLGARLPSAGDRVVFERVLSASDAGWLLDHRVGAHVLVPGVGVAELMREAAERVAGAPTEVADVVLRTPLALPAGKEWRVHVIVARDTSATAVYSQPADADPDAPWVTHATAVARPAGPVAPFDPSVLARCPEPAPIDHLYGTLDQLGLHLGPAFRAIRAGWLGAAEAVAELELSTDVAVDGYGLHPALFDAMVQAIVMALPNEGGLALPFAFDRVAVARRGARAGQVWVRVEGDVVHSTFADADGAIATIEGLRSRPVDASTVGRAEAGAAYRVGWTPVRGGPGDGSGMFEVHGEDPLEVTAAVLAAVNGPRPPRWIVTRGAVQVGPGDPVRPAHAAAWGLARSITLERPERPLTLVDLPDGEPAERASSGATDETELAWRPDGWRAARLVAAGAPTGGRPLRTDGVVLVTGGTGGVGRHVVRWLVERGVASVVAASRSGGSAFGPARVVSVDVTDEPAVRRLIASFDRPLRGVFHAAAVLDDGLAEHQTRERAAAVFAPKVTGAQVLDRLTRALDLDAFVLFSSIAGTLGSPGQSTYAAANAALDAIAVDRRARGLPAHSVAWGPWTVGSAEALDPKHQARVLRAGVRAMPPDVALAHLERVLRGSVPAQLVVDLDPTRVRGARVPSPLRSWVRGSTGPITPGPEGWGPVVAREVDRLLGADPDPTRTLVDRGLDSLLALELRDRLADALGAPLPPTLALDHPTVDAIARLLERRSGGMGDR